jgi:hypothetical protein
LAASGLERAVAIGPRSALPQLAAVLARNGKPEKAWQRFEEGLARGMWDDLSTRIRRTPAERDRLAALVQECARLDQLVLRSSAANENPDSKRQRGQLLRAGLVGLASQVRPVS